MQKLATGILITIGLILIFAFAFTLYAQFALDYSLETLKEAVETSQEEASTSLGNSIYQPALEGLVLEEATRKDHEFENVILLEHAARSLREAVAEGGYTQAKIYLTEVLKEKSAHRGPFLQFTDEIYHFIESLVKSTERFWNYLWKRVRPTRKSTFLEGGILLLNEAGRAEKSWKLDEAERYYREFLNRYADRPEQGFVKISLAHVLVKMRRFDEAEKLLHDVQREFSGAKEETAAASLGARIAAIRKKESRLPAFERHIKSHPDQIFSEKGGLDLALAYLATYQTEKALSILGKLQEAQDPRLRKKALFYQGWIHKWKGELDKGKELFQLLQQEPEHDDHLALATKAELADTHYQKKEYGEAANRYEELAQRTKVGSWKALSGFEQSQIYLVGLEDARTAQERLNRLEQILPKDSAGSGLTQLRLEEIKQRKLRSEGFVALAEGRIDAALEKLESYLRKFPRDGSVHSAAASIHVLRGFFDQALERAKEGYRYEQNEYTATVLGYVYEKMGKYDEAVQYYYAGTQLTPSYLVAQFNLAWVYATKERYEEADRLLAELEKRDRKPPPAVWARLLNNRGCTLWALGKKDEALSRFEQALKIMPDLPEARRNLKLVTGKKAILSVSEVPRLVR